MLPFPIRFALGEIIRFDGNSRIGAEQQPQRRLIHSRHLNNHACGRAPVLRRYPQIGKSTTMSGNSRKAPNC